MNDYSEQFTKVVATLGRECREWPAGTTDEAVEALITENSRIDDAIVFTDGSVKRGVRSGWGYTIRVEGQTVHEASGAIQLTTSSMIMEIKAITEALRYLQSNQHKRAVIVTDSMCTLKKIMNCFMYADWMTTISEGTLERIVWIFTPGHAGVIGNERADTLADTEVLDNNLTLDAPTVIQIVTEKLLEKRPPSSSYTLELLKQKGICPGDGARNDSRGSSRRIQNQLLMDTVSIQTLRTTLAARSEQIWQCAFCSDDNGGNR